MALFRCGENGSAATATNILAMEVTNDTSARSDYTFDNDYAVVYVSIYILRGAGSGLSAGVVFTPTLASGTSDVFYEPAQTTQTKRFKAALYNVKAGDTIANTGSTYAQTGTAATWDITGVN